MKILHCAALLIALLAVFLLAGCCTADVEHTLDKAEEAVEHRLEAAEDAAEQVVRAAIVPEEPVPMAQTPEPPAPTVPEPPAPTVPETTVPVIPETVPPANTALAEKLTVERAKAIALDHAGFAAKEVRFLRAEYDMDDRVPQYDIEFDVGRWEYEYEIHAETGRILSWEKDD